MAYDINNKVILVTGSNRGIGKVILEYFLEQGAAKVYAAVRNLETVTSLVDQYGEKVVPLMVDLANDASIYAAAEVAQDVDVVINNAGAFKGGDFFAEDIIQSLEFQMRINVYGLVNMAKAFAPVLKANGGGVFVQLNSIVSMKSFSNFPAYCTSKAASYSITQSLKELLGEQGTRVLSIHPGPIATDMSSAAGFAEIAEPPSLVPKAIIEALQGDDFHVFPDSMAKQIGGAYQSFAENVVEATMTEG
ncbi:MAG: SDR family oxidoreductase [Symploca sp. SIO2D2]|nr:SDR family oxidoreductase [Symploca sp. SIO2D2]